MKVRLLKGDTKVTFGEGEGLFDYWYRPLRVDEREQVTSHVVYRPYGKSATVDFAKTDVTELLKMAVTKIERLDIEGGGSINTIDDLLSASLMPGEIEDGILKSMWIEIWMSMFIPDRLKKK